MDCFVIIETSDICSELLPDCYHIQAWRRPTWLYFDQEKAEAELLRIQAENPGHDFYLFQAVKCARPNITDQKIYYLEGV